MRVQKLGDVEAQTFADLLLQLGNGDISETNGEIELPRKPGNKVGTMEEFISKMNPDISNIYTKRLE